MLTLLGIPWDKSSSFQRGAAAAPGKIREALWSSSSNSWNERGDDIAADGLLHDAGDVVLGDDAAEARAAIQAGVEGIVGSGRRPLVLGGDHSITYPVLRAFAAAPPQTIVHFDAHGDLYDSYEGDRYSHACPFARIMEERLTRRLIQIGVRTLSAHQRAQAARFGVEIFPPDRVADAVAEVSALRGTVYISLDIDVLEPMLAPGISHPEPGGLSVRDVIRGLHAISAAVVGADVVELNPANDVRDLTARVAAKFVKELTGTSRAPSAAPR
jgi:agmatinase